jgi:membrane-bound lytic murein transglycosylase D
MLNLKPNLLAYFLLIGCTFAFTQKINAEPLFVRYDFVCNSSFPCSEALKTRASFWMNVYSRWDNRAVFHDPEEPARVYAVLDDGTHCPLRSETEPAIIRSKRTELKELILSVLEKRDHNNPSYTQTEAYIRDLFVDADSEEMEEAADNIRCQQGIKGIFVAGLKRYGTYKSHILEELRQRNLPEDFQYLPFVESAYTPDVYSRVGAAGLWQLMPRTAKRKGLVVSTEIDQRLDPYDSTRAAVAFIAESIYPMISRAILSEMSDSAEISPGPFVLASYNYGPAGMSRAIRNIGIDYEEIIETYKSRRFGNAVKNFYPSFLAARELASHPEKYFGSIELSQPVTFAEAILPVYASPQRISEALNIPLPELRNLNPSILEKVWEPSEAKEKYLIPRGFTLKVPVKEGGWEPMLAELTKLPSETFTYVVAPGDTLSEIAKKLQISQASLTAANSEKLGAKRVVKVGQKLLVPSTSSVSTAQR